MQLAVRSRADARNVPVMVGYIRVIGQPPNSLFKPNLLRYTKHMAGKACHVFGSATQVGLTQVLGR